MSDYDKLEKRIYLLEAGLDNRVKFSTFTWVIGILMVIVIGLLGIIYIKVVSADTGTALNADVLLYGTLIAV